ncbi:hypothetical protein HAX54_029621 [Datura stramonium]|uniref:Uncharacterized protein n=1 Tax=Datura stramonium TaxID=4076 RepID=A0ABS8V8Z9_DATST|nr:hypothetical protein [Datura stramonium]
MADTTGRIPVWIIGTVADILVIGLIGLGGPLVRPRRERHRWHQSNLTNSDSTIYVSLNGSKQEPILSNVSCPGCDLCLFLFLSETFPRELPSSRHDQGRDFPLQLYDLDSSIAYLSAVGDPIPTQELVVADLEDL